MAKLVSGAEGTGLLGLSAEGRARFLRDFADWAARGAHLSESLVVSSRLLNRPITAEDNEAIKTALTPWFGSQPDTVDYP